MKTSQSVPSESIHRSWIDSLGYWLIDSYRQISIDWDAVESIQIEFESISHDMGELIHHKDESIHIAYYRKFIADNI